MKNFIFFILLLLTFLNSKAAVINNVQRGTTTLPANSGSIVQNITAVNSSSSFLVFTIRMNSNRPGGFQVSGNLSANNQITFTRFDVGGTPAVTIEWQVFEFSSGVFVQRGVVTNLPAAGTNVTLPTAVNLSRSFVLLNMRKDGGQYGSDDGINGDLTATNNLYIDRQGGGANPQNVYWQVIDWNGASVQKIYSTLNNGIDSLATTLPSGVNKNKTFVVSNHQLNANVNSDDLPATELIDNNNLIFTRSGTVGTFNFISYVIELSDNTDVVHGAIRFLSTENNVSTTICSVFSTTTAGIINGSNFNRNGANCHTADDNMGYNWATMRLRTNNTIECRRSNTGSAARFPFQVLEFSTATPSSCGNVEPGWSTPRTSSNGLCSVVLPVEFLNFNASYNKNKVELHWTTATEINNDYFTIQKSQNLIDFEDLTIINGAGNSSEIKNYFTTDENPTLGTSYYRIKQTDYNGEYDYSNIRSVNITSENHFQVFPNPVKNILYINYKTDLGNQLNIFIIDVEGRVILNKTVSSTTEHKSIKFKTNNLKKGFYFVKIEADDKILVKKFVKH